MQIFAAGIGMCFMLNFYYGFMNECVFCVGFETSAFSVTLNFVHFCNFEFWATQWQTAMQTAKTYLKNIQITHRLRSNVDHMVHTTYEHSVNSAKISDSANAKWRKNIACSMQMTWKIGEDKTERRTKIRVNENEKRERHVGRQCIIRGDIHFHVHLYAVYRYKPRRQRRR